MDEDGITLKLSTRAVVVLVFCFAFALGFYFHGQFEGFGERQRAVRMGESAVRNLNAQLLNGQGISGELEGIEKSDSDGLYLLKIALKQGNNSQTTNLYMTETGRLVLLGQGGAIVDIRGR